jgi:hypothetical protein
MELGARGAFGGNVLMEKWGVGSFNTQRVRTHWLFETRLRESVVPNNLARALIIIFDWRTPTSVWSAQQDRLIRPPMTGTYRYRR